MKTTRPAVGSTAYAGQNTLLGGLAVLAAIFWNEWRTEATAAELSAVTAVVMGLGAQFGKLWRDHVAARKASVVSLLALVLLAGCAGTTQEETKATGQGLAMRCEGTYSTLPDGTEQCDGVTHYAQGGPISEQFAGVLKSLVSLPGVALRAFFTGGL